MGVVTSTVGSATTGDRIDVDPEVLLRAGKKIGAVGTQLGMLSDALGSALSSGIASGMDPAGLNFGLKYGHQAQEFADTLAKAANSFKAVGYMLEATGCNYRNADTASTVGGPGPSGGVGPQPAETTPAHVSPGPNSGIVPPPLKWSLIEPFLFAIPGLGMIAGAAMTWPSGNPAMMRLTAAQWRNFATGLSAFDDDIAATKTAVSVLHIPEGTKIGEALEDLGTALTGLSGLCSSVAQSVEGFARGVQETQDAIRRMLDRLSVDGLWDTVKGFLSGDGEKILREIAHDIGALLNNFQQLVKGYVGLLDELIGLLGDAATAFEKWIRPILVAQFGDRIGGALASAVTLYTDFEVGVASGLIGTVSGVVSMLDPDTWKGMAELAVSVAADPSKLPGVLENMGKQFVAWDKWSGDHPGRAAGEAAFNIASLFVPGGALSKTGTVAKGLKFTKGLLEEGKLGQLGKLSELSSKTSKLDGLEDLSRVGPKVPEVPEIKPTPGIPEAVVSPRLPDAFDTPPSPHGLERPSGPPDPPDPPGPTGTRGDHGAGSGDHPPPDPPGRATGPSEPEPGRVDGPTAQPPASAGPVDAPRAQEPSAPGHTTSPGDQAAPGAHTPESTSPPGTHDDGRSPSEYGQPSTDHDGATPETHNNGPVTDDRGHSPGLSDGTGHPPNETHGPSSGEERVHTPTDHQPAHTPDTPHNGHERTTTDGSHTSDPSRGDGNTGRHDPGPVTPVGMPVGGMPPAAHAPGIPHTPAESLGAAGKTPEAPTRNPETKSPHGTSPESARTQSPATSGPTPGSAPVAPVKPAAGHPEAPATPEHAAANNAAEHGLSTHAVGDKARHQQHGQPNNPPHTGLHDPPANHGIPGDRLPDLNDINREFRLDDGSVDPKRFDEWTRRVTEAYPNISRDGVAGVYDYTTENYQGMNPYLRNVDPLSPEQASILGADSIEKMTDSQLASWEERISKTDDGLSSLPPYRTDPGDALSTTWRGMHASDDLLAQLKVGETFQDPAYLSTSTDARVAEQFALAADPGKTPTLLAIEGYDGVDVSQLSRYTSEAEILFPRGSKFEVISRELGEDGVVRIVLRQIER